MSLTRREFLRLLAPTASGLLATGVGGCRSTKQPALFSPTFAASPLPRAESATPPPVVAGRITPIAELYRQSYVPQVPILRAEEWSLNIDGEAGAPYTLTWADLRALPSIQQMHTLECIGNPVGGRLIGNVVWSGVSLRAVLERAAPRASARYLVMSAADEYFTAVPLELALDERSLLAFEAGGAPLPAAHGFPVRILLPGVYGQKQPKWVTSLRLTENYQRGVWEKKGWSDTATIRINSRIEYPSGRVNVVETQHVASLLVSGVAFADLSGVARVEVSADDGAAWSEATLYPGPTPMVWTAWAWAWLSPNPSRRVLQARATDGNGSLQSSAQGVLGDVFPDGTTGIHAVATTVAA